jgi:hypothetical protein
MTTSKRVVFPRFIATLAALILSAPAFAQFDDYEAGESCVFPIRVEFAPGPGLHIREFVDAAGRSFLIFTGNSPNLVVSNMESGESITFQPKGQRLEIIFNPDGSDRVIASGHTLVVWTVEIGEPLIGTFHYVGQLIIDTDSDGNSTIVKSTGRVLDVCSALS